jgi:hypothetical protein
MGIFLYQLECEYRQGNHDNPSPGTDKPAKSPDNQADQETHKQFTRVKGLQ